ncbi:hypothetical protein FQA39_LY16562 [Lamprigera yunnana]|nr:hypothetical protein FQA39_LY16562 [Lamprigera yunnana]
MDRSLLSFQDILKQRRLEYSNFMWISRFWKPQLSYEQFRRPSPEDHKQKVFDSVKIQEIIDKVKISQVNGVLKKGLNEEVWTILNEIGFSKRITLIRWLGLLLTKICMKVYSGIYVSNKVYSIKQLMGNKPVIFLPSHRSYADFILISYLCFTYNIEIPATAAGMDFHGMWGMGKILRNTGAFFMRRSFNEDYLYWDTFEQYIHQIITEGDLPLEFFIEGTRSRSGKSLFPKIGLLSMALKTFYTSAVPDILIIPINISYDRVLEEKLFAYELLGVPKPKESTSGFFKSLSIIKEQYGNIYIDFGDPISARDFFGSLLNRSFHSIKPIYMQELTEEEKKLTSQLASDIIYKQQKHAVITTFNVIALGLTHNFALQRKETKLKNLVEDVTWINNIVKSLGAFTEILDIESDIHRSLNVHKGLVRVTSDLKVELVENVDNAYTRDVSKLKGHALSQETMNYALPFVMLQIYVNPVLHYLVNPALLTLIVKQHKQINKDELYNNFTFFEVLLSHEFVSNSTGSCKMYDEMVNKLTNINLIHFENEKYQLGDTKLQTFLEVFLLPFLFIYYIVCKVFVEDAITLQEKNIFITVQAQMENMIRARNTFIHPYCLNLDSISNALSSLLSLGIITKKKINGAMIWQGEVTRLKEVMDKIEPYVKSLSSLESDLFTPSTLLSSKL